MKTRLNILKWISASMLLYPYPIFLLIPSKWREALYFSIGPTPNIVTLGISLLCYLIIVLTLFKKSDLGYKMLVNPFGKAAAQWAMWMIGVSLVVGALCVMGIALVALIGAYPEY